MPTSRNGVRAPSTTFVNTQGDRESPKGRKVSVLQVDRCKPILGLNAFDHAPVRQHLERELVQSPVQDSQIQDWPKATTFLGYDEVRAVKPLPHLGWRDRLDCILCQEDSNLTHCKFVSVIFYLTKLTNTVVLSNCGAIQLA